MSPTHTVATLEPAPIPWSAIRRPVRSAVVRSWRRRGLPRRIALRPGWPLFLFYGLYPLWWVCGLAVLGFFMAAVPMAVSLVSRRTIRVPSGFGMWLLFLVWVMAGVVVLWTDAPFAVPVEGAGRLVPFVFRVCWYLVATIFLLYVGNFDERELPTRKVVALLAWMFILTVIGGYLGKLAPTLEFPSILELVLPQRLAQNDFLNILIHPASAQLQDILGYTAPRPKAPFLYANDWGANYGLLLPFFVVAFLRKPVKGGRLLGFALLAAAAIPPVVFSLNRGLWLGLIAMSVYVIVRLALRGRVLAVAVALVALILSAGAISVTPLGDLIGERLNNPHSNEGRGNLSTRSVGSALEGSPVLGYGSTRDVQGNFFSIAGGETAECPKCSPPQLGTQGHIWHLIFTSGVGGTVLFLGFIYYRYSRSLRDASTLALALTAGGVYLAVVMLVYDILGSPLAVIMISLALLWRNERARLNAFPRVGDAT
jgi:hypothetical protein